MQKHSYSKAFNLSLNRRMVFRSLNYLTFTGTLSLLLHQMYHQKLVHLLLIQKL